MDSRFHTVQLAYLQSCWVEYLFATAEQKKEIPLTATDHLVALVEKAGRQVSDTERTGLQKNVREWFMQKCRRKKDLPKFGPKYTDEEQDEDKLPDYGGKSPTLFYFYKKALKHEWDLLTEDEKLSYEKKAAEWREHRANEEDKVRLAENDLVPYVEHFCHTMFNHLGVCVAVLCAMLNFNENHGGTGFKQTKQEGIKNTGIMPLWAKYNASVMGLSSNPYEIPWELKVNEYGEPLLKDPMNIPDLYQCWSTLPKVLRAFIKGHYACASGRNPSKVRPPWGEMFKQPQSFFLADHVPEKYFPIFCDPSKVNVGLVEELLNLFYGKQKEGRIAFEFHSYLGSKGVFHLRLPREAIQASSAEDGQSMPLLKPKLKKRARKAQKQSVTSATVFQGSHLETKVDGGGEKVKVYTPPPMAGPIAQVLATPASNDEANWEDVLLQAPISKPMHVPARKKAVILDSDDDTADPHSHSTPALPMESMPEKPSGRLIQSIPATVKSSPLQPIFSPAKLKTRHKAPQTPTMPPNATPLPSADDDATPPPITPLTIDTPVHRKHKAAKSSKTEVTKGREQVGGSSAPAAKPSSSAKEKALLADAASIGALEIGKRVRKPRIRDS
ncbi:hypothetical protein H1R20_g1180, partial [Candolleomyces eurysporus]